MVRKLGLALAVIATLGAGVKQGCAADLPIKFPGFPSAPINGNFSLSRFFGLGGGGSASLGALAAGGIIATAAVLCAYDVWLKFEGYKNWDGTPKMALARHRHHRGP